MKYPQSYAGRMSVELRHVRALQALAETDSFTTAAAVLRTTQPTFSRTIQQLEEITGVTLVERTTRSVRLTPAGRRFAERSATILQQLDDALRELTNTPERDLRLGWAWAGFGEHTVELLDAWQHHIGRGVQVSRCPDPLAALRAGTIDAALIRQAPRRPDHGDERGEFVWHPLYDEPLLAAVPHRLAATFDDAPTLAQLVRHPIAVCASATTTDASLWDDLPTPPATTTVSDTDEWLTHIALSGHVGTTSAATAHHSQTPDVRYLPIADAPIVHVALVFPRRHAHPAASAFAEYVGTHQESVRR